MVSEINEHALPENIPNGRREGEISQNDGTEKAKPAVNVIPQYRVLRTVAAFLVSLGLVSSTFINQENL